MNQASNNPLEAVLLAIDQAAPEPWYFQRVARDRDLDPDGLGRILELLYLQGLVQRGGPTDATSGPGVTLTDLGRQVLADPELVRRLRDHEPLTNDQGAIVRASLLRPFTPRMTRLLLAANFAVFAYCIYLARSPQALLNGYLMGTQVDMRILTQVLHPAGSISGIDLVRGEWWRMITAAFVHGGLMHIAFNMYALYSAGRFVEQTWGSFRYLLIYFISAWGGSCLAMALAPQIALVGASGALCGILAAEGAWIYLNARHLPRELTRRGKTGFITTVVLMGFISLMPGISGWGHLGGALAGGVAAIGLHLLRFAPAPAKLLGLLLVLGTPVGSYAYLQHQRATSPVWRKLEGPVIAFDLRQRLAQAMNPSITTYQDVVKPLRDRHPDRRDPAEVQRAIEVLAGQIQTLETLQAELQRAGQGDERRAAALAYTTKRIEVLRAAQRCLELGPDWKAPQEREFARLWNELRELRTEWEQMDD
ncbi:MAG: rhomboid family intramembrane serine protease [Gemmataceae bacterium]